MKNKWVIAVVIAVALVGGIIALKAKDDPGKTTQTREVRPEIGSIEKSITAMAVVQPQNRLEMKPPIAGRVDSIKVVEGQTVKTGEIVALMSSTERAALLDSARSRGDAEIAYWEEIYKPIPLIAPIDGTVIVSTMQPGQTVTQADPIIVLSDRLIVQAQIDETDVGKVSVGQKARVRLDAYPDIEVDAEIGHIYHESTTVNNVTIYKVDLIPQEIPEVFRSGMSATVSIVEVFKENVLTVPQDAITRDNEGYQALVRVNGKGKPELRKVEVGIADDISYEIVSGLTEKDVLVVQNRKYLLAKEGKGGSNPFMPQRQRRNSSGNRPS